MADLETQPSEDEKPKPRVWLALLPAVIVIVGTSGFVVRQYGEMNKVSKAVTGGAAPVRNARVDCIDAYSMTLVTSELYVREGYRGPRRQKNAPPELSTVLRGMARNNCGKPMRNVKIRIKVSDDDGKRGDSWAEVGALEIGQAKQFERAWMGRVTSYEIVEIR